VLHVFSHGRLLFRGVTGLDLVQSAVWVLEEIFFFNADRELLVWNLRRESEDKPITSIIREEVGM
jgi:hypothetical protein